MTTINTSDDLLRLLREDATFYADARRLILSEELLALPERFAALANRVDNFIEEQRQVNEEQRQVNEEQRQVNEEQRATNQRVDDFIEEQRQVNEEQRATNQRVDDFIEEQRQVNEEQRQVNEEQRQFNEEQREVNEEQRATNQRVDDFIEEQRATNRRLETAIGELRGNVAYRICRERADEIAEELGFIVIDIIAGLPLRELFRSNPPPDFTPGDRRSFYHADLIMMVQDRQENPAYLAVEVSYTADERDTRRALRNARFLNHITGLTAYAAVASRQNDQAIQELLDGGTVLWYQLPEEAFQPQ